MLALPESSRMYELLELKNVKFVLLDADCTLPFEQFATTEAIQMTEIFEYSDNIASLLAKGEGVAMDKLSDDDSEDNTEAEDANEQSQAVVGTEPIRIELPHEKAIRKRKMKGFDVRAWPRPSAIFIRILTFLTIFGQSFANEFCLVVSTKYFCLHFAYRKSNIFLCILGTQVKCQFAKIPW